MSLQSKSFLLDVSSNSVELDRFLSTKIKNNAYLIKGTEVNPVSDSKTQFTIFYKEYADDPIESFSPREGSIFTAAQSSNDFDVRLLFNEPIDKSSITDKTFFIDDYAIPTESIYVDPKSNNYFLKLSASGATFQTDSFHTYRVGSTLKRTDGSYFGYSAVGGYLFTTNSFVQLGDSYTKYTDRRRGFVSFANIKASTTTNIQSTINSYLSRQGIGTDKVLYFNTLVRVGNVIDIFLLYISKIEPQLIGAFPLNNSVLSSSTLPEKVTFIFSEQLDRNYLLNNTVFSIESGFTNSTPVPTNKITLLADNKTVELDVSTYFVDEKPYTILIRPGLKSKFGFIKEKPEQWTINIGPPVGSSVDSLFHAHTGDTSIHYDMSGISLTANQITDFDTAVTNLTGPLTGVVTGHSHFIAYSGVPPSQYEAPGMFWLDTSSSRTFIWYVDEDSSQWIQVF